MRCYDCGHPVHAGDCLECRCPNWGRPDPIDEQLRERPKKNHLGEYTDLT